MSDNVQFVIDWIPPTLNRALRMHWAQRGRERDTAAAYILAAIGRGSFARGRDRVRVRITMYRTRSMDQDGAFGACKPIFDCLVRLGWAVDDSPQWMIQEVAPVIVDSRPRTKIEIERIRKRAA